LKKLRSIPLFSYEDFFRIFAHHNF